MGNERAPLRSGGMFRPAEHWGLWPTTAQNEAEQQLGKHKVCLSAHSSFWVCLHSGTSLFVGSIVNSQNIGHTHAHMEVQKHTAKPNPNGSLAISWRPSIR